MCSGTASTPLGPSGCTAKPPHPHRAPNPKWKLYSGLFLLLKQKLELSLAEFQQVVRTTAERFRQLVQSPVQSSV